MDSLILVVGLVVLILMGAPIALAMVLLPTVYLIVTDAAPLLTVPYQMYEAVAKPALTAVPFFMLAGELMNSSTVTDRILGLSRALVGRVRGGLGQVNIVSSMFFGGMNGSAAADVATIGPILIPTMKKAGYSAAFSSAVTAASSTIGGILPPSIMMIILASAANLSVGAMFAGGIIPGLLVGFAMMALTYWISVKRDYERGQDAFSLKGLVVAFKRSAAALLVPLVLLSGILGGWFSSVEAGAVTCLVALIVGCAVYRDLNFRGLLEAVGRTVRLTAAIFVVVAASGPFGWLLAKIGVIQGLETWLLAFADNPALFALMLIGLVLVIGTFLDAPANIILLGPMLISTSVAAGFSDLTAALVVVIGFLMGMITPPVGTCWFLASRIGGASLESCARELFPFIAVEVVVLFLLLAIPWLTLGIPRLLGL